MVGAVPTAKMQVYERERGKILADSERGGRARECASWFGLNVAGIRNKDQNTGAKILS